MAIAIALFIVGLLLLIKGGDWFVDGATGIAHRFHIPELLIGATIVSIGTTLPEVMVSATDAFSGKGQIAYGNAIGSIICNTSLIAAITVAIRPSSIDRKTIRIPIAFFFGSAVIYSLVAYTTGYFSRLVGFGLLAIFVVYIVLSALRARKSLVAEANVGRICGEGGDSVEVEDADEVAEKASPVWKDIVLLVIGAALIALGANLLVNNGTIIAEKLGVPEAVIALTFVALGTSLPEFVTAITSLVKGHGSLSLGNIIGANLFNLVLVSGVATVVSPFPIPNNNQIMGINSSLFVDIPVMFCVMLILTVPALIRGKLSRIQGIALLAIYAAFCVFQFTM
ncbi:MAG: calcium/sodium antiporter [Clostridia bacterium]|nr:calcium/sodium antiporter [Clostridia bacterium]